MLEDANQHYNLLRSHEWYIRDKNRKDKDGNTAGRVSMALNTNHPPTRWCDIGIDPNDPMIAQKWTNIVTKGIQGYNEEKWMADAARQQGINFTSVRQ